MQSIPFRRPLWGWRVSLIPIRHLARPQADPSFLILSFPFFFDFRGSLALHPSLTFQREPWDWDWVCLLGVHSWDE